MNDYLTLTCEDNMELMARYPDNHFDLAIVDPPYGLGKHNAMGNGDKRGGIARNKKWVGGEWDKEKPSIGYFVELQRISKNQIVWGGNYFTHLLPQGDKWVVWDKGQRIDQSDCEIAWSSFSGALRIFNYHCSNLQGFRNPGRFHPTEKPIALYQWLLTNYANPGDKILDTHLGSGSIAIAIDSVNKVEGMNLTLTGCELDPEYFEKAMKRIEAKTAWKSLFNPTHP